MILIAGPCVLESPDTVMRIAEGLYLLGEIVQREVLPLRGQGFGR